MRRLLLITLLTFAVLSFSTCPASAGNGNLFPSGPHYNLNLIAKRPNFSCPPQTYYLLVTADNNGDGDINTLVESCDEGDVCVESLDNPIYGNVIFNPREQGIDPITVLVESGKKGPKSSPNATTLEVIDWCTESFPDDGSTPPPLGDSAIFRLPKNDEGYAVYARITGKPGKTEDEHTYHIIPDLVLVQDETGNDLIMLGLVTPTGVYNPEGILLKRTDDSRKGKGVKKATDITSLFEWTGEVCYVQTDSDLYCIDDEGNNICTSRALCCVDTSDPSDGVYDRCDLLTDVGVDPGDGNLVCPLIDAEGYSYVSVDAQCRDYDNDWVFNIGDFVDVLWHITSTGAYVVQVRFYPMPLINNQ